MAEATQVRNERKILDALFSGAEVKVSCPGCGNLLYRTSVQDHVDELKCPACKHVSQHRITQGSLISRLRILPDAPLANSET